MDVGTGRRIELQIPAFLAKSQDFPRFPQLLVDLALPAPDLQAPNLRSPPHCALVRSVASSLTNVT